MPKLLKIVLIIALCVTTYISKASHLIVGEISYKNLGNNNYEINLIYYRDCRPPSQGGGSPTALQEDNPAAISIYKGNNFLLCDTSITAIENVIVSNTNPNACENSNTVSCVNKLRFVKTIYLPPSNEAYTIVNQRCCMNESIINISNPSTNGYTFYCTIPPNTIAVNNSSAVFSPVYDTKYCVNKKYEIDHSAKDIDGDSLSYGFTLLDVGGSAINPKPAYIGSILPDIIHANYLAPYSVTNPMPGISINSHTGIISLLSPIQGSYIVNVFCVEWRNGVMIDTIKRTYLYTIYNCNFEANASIACDSNLYEATKTKLCYANCNSKQIHFKNKSQPALAYHWDFGVSNIVNDTSSLFEPTYTYPDTGIYKVVLYAYGATCTDSIIEYVSIYNDEVNTDFNYVGILCTGAPIQFNSLSSSLSDSISYWIWHFTNPQIAYKSYEENPLMELNKEGYYHIVLNSITKHGCSATAEKDVSLTTLQVNAYSDTTIFINDQITLLATGADNYTWDLNGNINAFISTLNISNPIFLTTHPGKYKVFVTGINVNECKGYDSIYINSTNVENNIFVPNAFTPNGDNLNDELKVFLVGQTLKYFKVYNRRGQEVFSTGDKDKGWNGKFNGGDLGIDTYYWLISAIDNKTKQTKIFKGEVLLMR